MASILIVDDEPAVRKYIKRLAPRLNSQLEAQHAWYYAGNYDEAMSVARQVPIDVVFTDINMPDQDGFAVLAGMNELFGQQIVKAVVSAYAGKTNYQRALEAGVCHFLEKPIEFDTLVETVAKCLSRLREEREKGSSGSRVEPMEPLQAVLHLVNQLETSERKAAAFRIVRGLGDKEMKYFLKECQALIDKEEKAGWIDSVTSGGRRYYRLRYRDENGKLASYHIGPNHPEKQFAIEDAETDA